MRFGSLFSGCGATDLGLQRAGMEAAWQVEIDKDAVSVLERHWPEVQRYGDIQEIDANTLSPVDIIVGGDPCPHRSRARSIWGTDSPDLWPEFLRIVRALRPVWVLREHVVSDDADDCWADLVTLGYGALILEADSAEVTGQSRPREYLCGVLAATGICPGEVFCEPVRTSGNAPTFQEAAAVARCLTARSNRREASDNYLLEPGRGTRILAPVERERLQGLPDGWTAGPSDTRRASLTGNAVTVPIVEWIGNRIMEVNHRRSRADRRWSG